MVNFRMNFSLASSCILLILALTGSHGAMTDKATGIDFSPNLDGLSLFGVGVRKKGPIKIYSVGMYASAAVRENLSNLSKTVDRVKALSVLRSSAKSTPPTTFLLKMNFGVGAQKIADALADSVAPRYSGSTDDVERLKSLIFDGVSSSGDGSAKKGTTFQFDCGSSGLDVTVNGMNQGSVDSPELSKSFCDVYLDDKAVSPKMRTSVLDNCCK